MRTIVRVFVSTVTPLLAIGAFAFSLPMARAHEYRAPPVPADLEVDAGATLFLVGHAVGTQNYVCLPSGAGFAWTLFTPQATLFKDEARQVTTHFFSPNPDQGGTVRAAWQHSRDSSTVWASLLAASIDRAFVAKDAIPWLKLEVVGEEPGPDGGDALSSASFIQRLNTTGGVAPVTGCAAAADVGAKAFVPYTADYFFYSGP